MSSATQYVWQINDIDDPYLQAKLSSENPNIQNYKTISASGGIKGFIATTQKPSDLKIRGTDEKISLDLFVNGRLREKDILKHIPTARIVESYTYGQIHFDELDYDEEDAFTSSREGVISDDPKFKELIDTVKKIFKNIIDEWDILRVENGHDGDPDNPRVSVKERKAKELFSVTLNDIVSPRTIDANVNKLIDKWVKNLREESQFNIPAYTECYIAENILRNYIKQVALPLSPEAINRIKTWRKRESDSKQNANISFEIRHNNHDLQYLDMADLANLIDKQKSSTKQASIARSAVAYKPPRDAMAHTALLTLPAKQQLSIEFENIKARLQIILDLGEGAPHDAHT